jgi:hypothetical protein
MWYCVLFYCDGYFFNMMSNMALCVSPKLIYVYGIVQIFGISFQHTVLLTFGVLYSYHMCALCIAYVKHILNFIHGFDMIVMGFQHTFCLSDKYLCGHSSHFSWYTPFWCVPIVWYLAVRCCSIVLVILNVIFMLISFNNVVIVLVLGT